MNFRKKQYDDDLEINLIPLIDVLLVILIFLAATTSFNRDQQLKLTLPRADAEALQQDTLRLSINHDGLYALQGQVLSGAGTEEIAASLRQLRSADSSVAADSSILVIEADAQAAHASVVRAMEAARLAGIERVHFATQSRP